MQIRTLMDHLNTYLNAGLYKDYAPNGLQVEGRDEVKKIIIGVTACQELIDYAVREKADAILVHHGWFWRGEAPQIVGMKKRRLAAVLSAGINLIAYHLPLDAHPEVGNNAEIARILGLRTLKRTGFYDLLNIGEPIDESMTVESLVEKITVKLERRPIVVGKADGKVGKIAWCTGAAQDSLLEAVENGCNVYISGEISERTTYEARENGVTYIAAGHHATERYGVQALAEHLKKEFPELEFKYFETDNIV